ncbi:MAG: Gfo/Idh/MocA family oxidoreductase [Pirellulaceae bacterium]|nr:Gfo/Idh/MocA family oxidoreductase [Pirellulaceae bacterium]
MPRSSRRRFLQTSAAASAALALPYYVPSRAFGANERIVTGHIGVGAQGKSNLSKFLANAGAVCDVDSARAALAAKVVEDKGNKCEVFGDYRKLLDRKDIDAVVISTPDHWHTLPAIDACRAGKDVYCEKPLTLFIAEGRKLVEAARSNKRIVQTGSQQRSDAKFRQACELVRNGRLGQIKTVLVGIPGPNHAKTAVPDSDPPAELDYETWLGPAPQRPYNKNRVHYNFRFYWDYSGGQMTNFGAHHIDIAQWGLGMDGSGPVSSEGECTYADDLSLCEVTKTCRVTHTYANGVQLIVGQGQKDIPQGCTFIGEKGQIFVTRGKITTDKPELLAEPLPSGATRLYVSADHHKNFLECIASRKLPIADVEIGHRTATVCHLGNIALRLGRKINWDPQTEQITGDPDAAAMLVRPYRAPWKLA